MKSLFCAFLTLALATISFAQTNQSKAVKSIDGIIAEFLDHMTIEKGEIVDTATVRSLFHPSARFMVNDSTVSQEVTLEDFLVLITDDYYTQGYLEKEVHKITQEFNGIAHVFQTFYAEDSEGSKERGINSYQLAYNEGRWWIVNMLWTVESENARIPKEFGGE